MKPSLLRYRSILSVLGLIYVSQSIPTFISTTTAAATTPPPSSSSTTSITAPSNTPLITRPTHGIPANPGKRSSSITTAGASSSSGSSK